MQHMTPKEIVTELDKYIVGQADAKRAVAIAIRNRWRRQQLPDGLRQDVSPKNIIMSGPTGVGKTEIARRLAALTGAPFIKVEATKFTEVGYHGRDVDSMIRDLLDTGIAMVRAEMTETVKNAAETYAEDRLIDSLLPGGDIVAGASDEDRQERRNRSREKIREQLRAGQLEDRTVDISIEDKPSATGMLGSMALEMDVEMQSMFERMMPSRRETKKFSVKDARNLLLGQEAEKMLDKDKVLRAAIERVEQSGIVFLDEIDKICSSNSKQGPDVSRQGVQRDLLPLVEGTTVVTKHGPVKTDHVLFIAAGAFFDSQVADLMPELQGRFPIRVELADLSKADFVRILTEPQNSLTKQTVALLATEGVEVVFTDDAVNAMAQIAFDVNKKTQNIGARRLYTILEKVFETISYEAPDRKNERIKITGAYVYERVGDGEKRGWFGL